MRVYVRNQNSLITNQAKIFLAAICVFLFANNDRAFGYHDSQSKASINTKKSCESSGFFERHAEGWHWYDTPRVEPQREIKQKREASHQKNEKQSPTDKIEAQRKKLEQKLHAAILDPNEDNIISYIQSQKAVMDQSQKFSESWKRVVMTNPSLDETLTYPVDQNARQIYYHEKNQEIQDRIKKLAGEYGLFFFFRKECAYCQAFAPIVKNFSKSYGWTVLPISLDGRTLPEFPKAKRDNGIAEKLQITHVPALIALHPKSGKLIPLAYGMTSMSEIEQRVELLTQLQDEMKWSKNK